MSGSRKMEIKDKYKWNPIPLQPTHISERAILDIVEDLEKESLAGARDEEIKS